MSKVALTTAALIALFNPANAANLTEEDLQTIQSLTKEQVEELAKAYPNTPHSNNYLLLYDKKVPADKQLYQLSSWQNLKRLWDLSQNNFVPFGFRGHQGPKAASPAPTPKITGLPASKVVDLSQEEATGAEGLKQVGEGGVSDVVIVNAADVQTTAPVADGASDNSDPDAEKLAKIAELEAQLEQLKADGAHHMTIKKVEKDLAELKGE